MALVMAKLVYLRKQKTFLRNYKKEIVRHKLHYLDKLDILEEKEKKEYTLFEEISKSSFELRVFEFNSNFDYSFAKKSFF